MVWQRYEPADNTHSTTALMQKKKPCWTRDKTAPIQAVAGRDEAGRRLLKEGSEAITCNWVMSRQRGPEWCSCECSGGHFHANIGMRAGCICAHSNASEKCYTWIQHHMQQACRCTLRFELQIVENNIRPYLRICAKVYKRLIWELTREKCYFFYCDWITNL